MSERFDVATGSGFLTARRGKHAATPGLSAHVIDRSDNCRVVATYRSEELPNHVLPVLRHERTCEMAREHADRLNALANDEGNHGDDERAERDPD
jgi:hypothetical protein